MASVLCSRMPGNASSMSCVALSVGALMATPLFSFTQAFSIHTRRPRPQLSSCFQRAGANAFGSNRISSSGSSTEMRSSVPCDGSGSGVFSSAMESATQAPPTPDQQGPASGPGDARDFMLGGDFCGLLATYHPGDGHLIPLPAYLVPEALREWGQEPIALEVLVSEGFQTHYDGEHEYGTEPRPRLLRDTVTVLPDTGCSIDNLETTKVADDIDLSSQQLHDQSNSMMALQYATSGDLLRVETIFKLEEEPIDSGEQHRIRVVMDLIPADADADAVFAVQTPMALIKERRTSTESSGGTIADGGGLDGRTVSKLMGNLSPKFLEEKVEAAYKNVGIQYISLPGGIEIAYGWTNETDWVLQVSHLHGTRRRVVSRHFQLKHNSDAADSDSNEISFHVEMWQEKHQPN